jgi:hypothetical protein
MLVRTDGGPMTTVRATAVVLLLALACSACSGSGPSTVQRPSSVVSRVAGSCQQGGGTSAQCGSAVRYLKDHYDPSGFTSKDYSRETMDAATNACAAGLGNSGTSGNSANMGKTWSTNVSGSTTTLTLIGIGPGGTPTSRVPTSTQSWLIHYIYS